MNEAGGPLLGDWEGKVGSESTRQGVRIGSILTLAPLCKRRV